MPMHACIQFAISFEPFILVGLQQTMGLPYLMRIFAGNASLYCNCVSSQSFFFDQIKSYFWQI